MISWMRFNSADTYIVPVEDRLDDFLTNIENFAECSEKNYSCERMEIKESGESHKKEEDIKEKKVISISDNMTFIIGYPFGMPPKCLVKRGLTGLIRFAQRINLNDDDFLKLEEKEIYEYSASYKEASKIIWLKEYYKGDVNGSIDKVYVQRIRAIYEKVDIDKELLRCNEKLQKELEELKTSTGETILKLRTSLAETKRSLSEAQEKIKNMERVKKNLLIVSEAINKVITTNEVDV